MTENGQLIIMDRQAKSESTDAGEIARSEAIARRMAPRGALGLSPLLEERRLEFGITNKAFVSQAVYDRVFVFQIPMVFGDKFEGSTLYMPDTTRAREANGAPRGIVISAGPIALDAMRSNGIDLGHIIYFVHAAPYHIRYDLIEGKAMHMIVLTAGDIVSSEDLADNLRTRKVRIIQDSKVTDRVSHTFIDETGKPLLPQSAWRAED